MKEKLINNLGIKILSICLAAFFWIVIVNIDDPVKTRTFSNVPVQVINESTLTSKNKAYDILSGDMVDFTVTGKRTQLEKLKKSDFIVTADLSQLTPPFDTIKINVECTKYSDLEISMGKVSTMKISLEDIISEQFSVKVVTSGNPAPGYAADKTEVSPVLLKVSGAESIVQEIADVKVLVDISGVSEDVTKIVVPKAYNEKGIEIDSSKLTFSYHEIKVTVSILETKTIPVVLTQTGEVAYGYQLEDVAYEPQEIEIKGSSSMLNKITSIPISVDINELREDKEYTISVREILEEYNVSVVDSDMENIVVKVTVQKLIEKTFSVSKNDIIIDNLSEGLTSEFADDGLSYTIKLMGIEEDINNLTAASLTPRIDLRGLGVGRYEVELKVVVPDTIKVLSASTVTVRLTKEDEEPVVSETPSSEENEEEVSDSVPSVEPSVQPSETPSEMPDSTLGEDGEEEGDEA